MKINILCENLLNNFTNNVKEELYFYFNNTDIIDEIYFKAKKLDRELINSKLNDQKYIEKVLNTLNAYKSNIKMKITDYLNEFMQDTGYGLNNEEIYIIIGLDTTTIYSTKYQNREVTVLCLESTNGDFDNLKMLLAHEFTHFIRRNVLKKDIFEESIGERFVTEGIASNYSREMVPTKKDCDYCIVPETTIDWVKNNIKLIDELVNNKLSDNELMEKFFYMYADTKIEGMPVRCGYVYGYLKVKKYLEDNNLKIKDILGISWDQIII